MKIRNYKFELRGFKYLASRSLDSNCFGVALYVNGKKLAECGNNGYGGPTEIYIGPKYKAFGKEVEAFLKTQPKIKSERLDFEFDCDLEYIVDELADEEVNKREQAKIMTKTKTSLLFRSPDGDYFTMKWKIPLMELLKKDFGPDAIKKTIAVQTKEGNTLMNDNIPANLLPAKTKKHK